MTTMLQPNTLTKIDNKPCFSRPLSLILSTWPQISHHRPLAPIDIYGEEVQSIGNIVVLSTAPTPPYSDSSFVSLPPRFLGCFRLLFPRFFSFSSLPRSLLATLIAISQSEKIEVKFSCKRATWTSSYYWTKALCSVTT